MDRLVEKEFVMVGLSIEHALYGSKWIAGIDWIATWLR